MLKYVRHKTKGFFLFPDSGAVWHSQVGRFLGISGIISAGFVVFNNGAPICMGYSDSLEMGPAKEDTQLLRDELGVS